MQQPSTGPPQRRAVSSGLTLHQTVQQRRRLVAHSGRVLVDTGKRWIGEFAQEWVVVDAQNRHLLGDDHIRFAAGVEQLAVPADRCTPGCRSASAATGPSGPGLLINQAVLLSDLPVAALASRPGGAIIAAGIPSAGDGRRKVDSPLLGIDQPGKTAKSKMMKTLLQEVIHRRLSDALLVALDQWPGAGCRRRLTAGFPSSRSAVPFPGCRRGVTCRLPSIVQAMRETNRRARGPGNTRTTARRPARTGRSPREGLAHSRAKTQ